MNYSARISTPNFPMKIIVGGPYIYKKAFSCFLCGVVWSCASPWVLHAALRKMRVLQLKFRYEVRKYIYIIYLYKYIYKLYEPASLQHPETPRTHMREKRNIYCVPSFLFFLIYKLVVEMSAAVLHDHVNPWYGKV